MADQLAVAMAQGKFDEFLKREMPDNEHARKLAEMMMGMTGMMAPAIPPVPSENINAEPSDKTDAASDEQSNVPGAPPEDVVKSVQSGDVSSLMELLAREYKKRTGNSVDTVQEEKIPDASSSDKPAIDKEIIDQLINISADNNLSLDWLFFRALKRYVEEYRKTGNL